MEGWGFKGLGWLGHLRTGSQTHFAAAASLRASFDPLLLE